MFSLAGRFLCDTRASMGQGTLEELTVLTSLIRNAEDLGINLDRMYKAMPYTQLALRALVDQSGPARQTGP